MERKIPDWIITELRRDTDELKEWKAKAGVREDWHEPDEQQVTAKVEGRYFDNAGTPDELTVVLTSPSAGELKVNLATLCAIASLEWRDYYVR